MTEPAEEPAAQEPDIVPPEDVPPLSAEELVNGEAPDEAAGGEDERRYPSTIGGAFYLAVLAASGAALAIVVTGAWRQGIRVMGGALLFGALCRLALGPRDAGMLAVRYKWLDALLLIALGAALIVLAGSIPDQPGP
ncbi:hypothetical protein DDE18_03900 [Nocardioides gansuensis]|uniref:DUF3017 domain-containing protein n=1 Tax=Nocardioides gansuensis TaxID=2138300 RepID=A0A2T8FGA3_9ACTN|nr:DUF3017 domain-containing protein [Nocardioides gansuensis]PVG84751.1 hypothetical protein DDE18_03900 [Nocardioides gansuensis]